MKLKKQKKLNILKPLFWIISLGIVSCLVFLTIELSTVGLKLSKFQEGESVLKEEKRNLLEAIARSNSLNFFEDSAENLGFVRPEKIIYITDDQGIANKL